MELEPAIEDRHDIYQSIMIDLISKVNGSKDDVEVPFIDWGKSYKEANVDLARAELDEMFKKLNNKKT